MGEPSMDKVFTCTEITQITDTFKTCIGEGAYGQVFLGMMSDGTRVAVKVLPTQDSLKGFSEEAKLLRIHHPNLVTLIGYCDDDVKKALICEYVPNGDLGRHLSENSKRILLWDERLKIAQDIAEGINFLHGQKPPIVHRDLKPANILLTEDMQAKIAGFILSRAFPAEFATHVSTPRAGTFGYLDPHVFELGHSRLGPAKKENDVYSFGVILLVLLTGKPAIIGEGNDAIHITQWIESVTKSFTKKKKTSVVDSESIQSIIDPRLQGQFDIYAAKKAIKLAMSCVKPITKGRPNMSHALEKLKAISNPKEKAGFFTNIITWVRSCFPFANSQSQNISYQMDKEGIPSIALANKATGQAIKHSIEATPLVQLVSHDPKKVDKSPTFTACDLPSPSSANPQNISACDTTDADGGLSSVPLLRFNKQGNLLDVTTADNGFKILANAVGLRSLRATEASSFEALRTSIDSPSIKVSGTSAVASVGPVSCKVERSSPVRPSPMLNGVDPMGSSVEKPRTLDDATDKTKPWQLAEIVDPIQCRLVTLPESTDASSKVVRLLYTNSGVGILALGSNGVQKLWKWTRNEQNPTGMATASVVPQHWQPKSGLLMINDGIGVNDEEAVPCIALSKNDCYVISAAGGKVSLFNMMTFKLMATFMAPPLASTFLAFHPQDNNILAIGMEDSTVHIYNVRVDEVKSKLKGHQKRITGLAFSSNLNILVSSGADAQLCVWSIDTWEKSESVTIQIPAGKAPTGDTRVQFHTDQIHMLVVHETQLAIYDASKIERIRQWIPQDGLSAPISYAAYSCNSQLVYASFCDGNIGVFDADTLRLRCRVAPSAYLPQSILNGSQAVYPLVVAAHPSDPNQFAIGLTDGSVKVMEPTESEGKWGASPPVDNGILSGRTTSSSTSNHTPEQLQR